MKFKQLVDDDSNLSVLEIIRNRIKSECTKYIGLPMTEYARQGLKSSIIQIISEYTDCEIGDLDVVQDGTNEFLIKGSSEDLVTLFNLIKDVSRKDR